MKIQISRIVGVALLLSFFIYDVYNTHYKKHQKYLYMFDAGHGYRPQSCGYKSIMDEETGECFYEYQFNLALRKSIMEKLKSNGIEAVAIPTDEEMVVGDVPRAERIKRINDHATNLPKILISIHANEYGKDTTVKGYDIFVAEHFSPIDTLFALRLGEQISKLEGCVVRHKFTKKNFDMVFFPNVEAALLVENDFFTNPTARKKMLDEKFIEKLAQSYVNTILLMEQ